MSVPQILAQAILTPHSDVRIADFDAVGMVGTLTVPASRSNDTIDDQIVARRIAKTIIATWSITRRSTAGGCSCDSDEYETHEELHRGCERCGVVSRLGRSWQVAE